MPGKPTHDSALPDLDIRCHALFLDIDGTLVDIQADPDAVAADAELCDLLTRLQQAMGGAVAAVTGRAVAEADRILAGTLTHVAGLHGRAFRIGDTFLADRAGVEAVRAARAQVDDLVTAGTLDLRLEDKGSALALHFRHAPWQEDLVFRLAGEIARRCGLRVIHGKMVAELIAGSATKGTAIHRLMAEPAFCGRVPVALGDDLTDEDAFAACAAEGGFGILVGDRPSAATHRLADVAAVQAWLRAALPGTGS